MGRGRTTNLVLVRREELRTLISAQGLQRLNIEAFAKRHGVAPRIIRLDLKALAEEVPEEERQSLALALLTAIQHADGVLGRVITEATAPLFEVDATGNPQPVPLDPRKGEAAGVAMRNPKLAGRAAEARARLLLARAELAERLGLLPSKKQPAALLAMRSSGSNPVEAIALLVPDLSPEQHRALLRGLSAQSEAEGDEPEPIDVEGGVL